MILLTACKFDAVSICSVCAFFADMQRSAEKAKTLNSKQESARIPDTSKRGEIKKMQKRRKTPRRRTIVRQRRFSAVEKADNHSFGEIR